jgi:twitching motility protein PilI
MAAKGFIKLLEIAERSKKRGLGLLGQGANAWTGVGFLLSGENFLTPIGEVAEILKTPRYTMSSRCRAVDERFGECSGTIIAH